MGVISQYVRLYFLFSAGRKDRRASGAVPMTILPILAKPTIQDNKTLYAPIGRPAAIGPFAIFILPSYILR